MIAYGERSAERLCYELRVGDLWRATACMSGLVTWDEKVHLGIYGY